MITVIGVDPGVVHTGVVAIRLHPENNTWMIAPQLFMGLDPQPVKDWCKGWDYNNVFIEGYRPWSHFSTDADMSAAINEMKKMRDASVLNNMGIKNVIKPPMMEMLGVWKFKQSTHHQDLRSAARIGLYGLVKDPIMNRILTGFVTDQLDGKEWKQL